MNILNFSTTTNSHPQNQSPDSKGKGKDNAVTEDDEMDDDDDDDDDEEEEEEEDDEMDEVKFQLSLVS